MATRRAPTGPRPSPPKRPAATAHHDRPTAADLPRPRGRGPEGNVDARRRILLGAAMVFSAQGPAGATVEDILGAAAVSRRTFYRFFADKEQVLEALFEASTALVLQRFRDAAASADQPLEKLRRCVDVYVGLGREAGPLMRVLHGEAQRSGSRLAAHRARVLEEIATLFADEAHAALGVRPATFLLRALLLAAEGLLRTVTERQAPTEADFERAKQAMLRILTASLAGDGPLVAPLPLGGHDGDEGPGG